MRNLVITLVVLLAGCVALPPVPDAGDRVHGTTSFTEGHHKTKDAAFVAAAAWISDHYKGGKDILQQADKGSGTMIAKGAYHWSLPIDSFNLHFHEGWVEYSLKVKITDTTAEMEFITGEIYGEGEHGLKDLMPQIVPYFQNIRNGIMKAISEK